MGGRGRRRYAWAGNVDEHTSVHVGVVREHGDRRVTKLERIANSTGRASTAALHVIPRDTCRRARGRGLSQIIFFSPVLRVTATVVAFL